MNNKIPKELAERQKQQRQNTANTVRKAIEDLSSEGHKITIKLLMEYTGLSRSVFGKEHVKEVLIEHSIYNSKSENICTQKINAKERLQLTIKRQNERITELKNENLKLKEECELLRGCIFLQMKN